MPTTYQKLVALNYKAKSTALFAAIFIVLLSIFAYNIDPSNYSITYIICLAGASLGWLIGIITSPYDSKDKDNLGKFSKLVGSFLSGYLLSKIEGVTTSIFKSETLVSQTIGGRMLLFFCFFVIFWITTFVFRQYTKADDPKISV